MEAKKKNNKIIILIIVLLIILVSSVSVAVYLYYANRQAHLEIQPTFSGRPDTASPNQAPNNAGNTQ